MVDKRRGRLAYGVLQRVTSMYLVPSKADYRVHKSLSLCILRARVGVFSFELLLGD